MPTLLRFFNSPRSCHSKTLFRVSLLKICARRQYVANNKIDETRKLAANKQHAPFPPKSTHGTRSNQNPGSGYRYPPESELIRTALFGVQDGVPGAIHHKAMKRGAKEANNLIDSILDSTEESIHDKILAVQKAFFLVNSNGDPWKFIPETNKTFRDDLKLASLSQLKRLLQFFNGYTERVRSTDAITFYRHLLGAAVISLQARSIPSLRKNISLLSEAYYKAKDAEGFYEIHGHRVHALSSIFRQLYQWVLTDPFDGYDRVQKLQQLRAFISEAMLQKPTDTPRSLYYGLDSNVLYAHGAAISKSIVYCLGRMCDPALVFESWLRHKAVLRSHFFSSQNSLSVNGGPPSGELPTLRYIIFQYHVQALAYGGHGKLAWEFATANRALSLSPESWKALLEYPEYISEWKDEMTAPMLANYENHVTRIERALGIKWTGGEDGKHVFVDDEGFEEDVDKDLFEDAAD